jgi:hypothetical protein
MEFQDLPAQPSDPVGQQVTERTARHLPRLRMLALGIALLAGGVALAVQAGRLGLVQRAGHPAGRLNRPPIPVTAGTVTR